MQLGEFYSAHTHVNDVTGCVIWDMEYAKGGLPVLEAPTGNIPVRDFVYQSVNGKQPYRTKYIPTCENPHCVKFEHIRAIPPEAKKMDVPQEKVSEAWKLYEEGLRQEKIAERMGVDPSTVSKWIKIAKLQKAEEEALDKGG